MIEKVIDWRLKKKKLSMEGWKINYEELKQTGKSLSGSGSALS